MMLNMDEEKVEFIEEEEMGREISNIEKAEGKPARWLIAIGLARNERAANKIIISISIIILILAIFIIFKYVI
jgi:t-SNARE complex subunit (syntaxin)